MITKSLMRRTFAVFIVLMIMAGTMTSFANEIAKRKYGFTNKQIRYELGMDAEQAFKTLGAFIDSRDVNTCANGYINRAYTYSNDDKTKEKDFEVYVEQDRKTGKDVVASITLMSSSVATEEGLKVGDTADRVTAVYPTAKKGLGSYKIIDGTEELYVKLKGGKVSYISYVLVSGNMAD